MVGSTLVYLGQPARRFRTWSRASPTTIRSTITPERFVLRNRPPGRCPRPSGVGPVASRLSRSSAGPGHRGTHAGQGAIAYLQSRVCDALQARVHLCRREALIGQENRRDAVTLSPQARFAQWVTGGTFLRGWALIERGDVAEGIAQLREAQATWQAMGTEAGSDAHLRAARRGVLEE
jgi:hypothetical protein